MNRKTIPGSILLATGLLVLVSLAVAPGARASDQATKMTRSQKIVESWRERIEAAEEHLLAGQWKKADHELERLLREIQDRFYNGPSDRPVIGAALGLRAVAEAGRGRSAEAVWDWSAAVSFDHSVLAIDLAKFGEAGRALLAAIKSGDCPDLEDCPPVPASPGFRAPELTSNRQPRFPESRAGTCREGVFEALVRVDHRGIPVSVRFDSEQDPIWALAACAAMREWRYDPALSEGRPVALNVTATVDFSQDIRFRLGCSGGTD